MILNSIDVSKNAISWAVACAAAVTVYLVSNAVYNIFFHPLARYPGPVSHAVSRVPYFIRVFKGTLPFDMLDLHKRYGDIVRIAPDELAFSHPDAWKDILGHSKGGLYLEKASWFYRPLEYDPPNIFNESRHEHSRLRRQLAHSFSDKGMRDQEPMIRGYIDLLLQRLREIGGGEDVVDLSAWFNYTTFDIIGDLSFGEPFGCLQDSSYHEWIESIFLALPFATALQALSFMPFLKQVVLAVIPRAMRDRRDRLTDLTRAMMLRRVAISEERPDLIEGLLKKKEELGLTIDKLTSNAETLVIAGSETTATLLSGVTYLLLTNPEAYQTLTKEVRSAFHREEDITLGSVVKLPFMLACLDEALRMYPPGAIGPPRTYVSIHHWALYRREEYFTDPHTFHPERFLWDTRFLNDRRNAFQPFHLGPRSCLGRNLAYSEMRLILALMIFHFDLQLSEDSQDWIRQKNILMWQRGPLNVHLTPIHRNHS
ncbi:cytochrome P450 [Aspergillus pseudotamarii]|uniref:Cytochrome P450 n=1 Tax=Aspergillus pseudotamarii TaxID=132259 RepID=A0A5N6SYR7_ASPPS|nr:cytochrome P450 [Aspergillus pseudotamarii]KAE8138900.1 cytochrome P450 [Aspergillus pseudotamarii]